VRSKSTRCLWHIFPLHFVLFMSVLGGAQVNNYYVSPTGSDSNNGSQSQPWKTIQHAANSIGLGSTGTVVHVLPGTYNENVSYAGSGGSNTQRVVFQSEVPHGAKIVGQGAGSNVVHIGTGSTVHGGNYVTVQGFEVTGPASNQGIVVQGHDDWVIGNKVHHVQTSNGCPSSGGLGVGSQWNGVTDLTSQINNIFDGNLVYNIGSFPTLCNYTHGIYIQTPSNIVRNNVVLNAAGYGIQTYHYVTNEVIVNNTVFHNNESGIFISAADIVNDYNTITNNIVVNNNLANSSGGIRETAFCRTSVCATGTHNFISNNDTFGNTGGNYNLEKSAALNQITSGTTGSIFTNYTADPGGDYHLQSGSSAVGTGTANCASGQSPCVPKTDFDDLARVSPYDNGAFAFGTGSSTTLSPPTGLTATVQ
jgi:pectate disaccharide-lyase